MLYFSLFLLIPLHIFTPKFSLTYMIHLPGNKCDRLGTLTQCAEYDRNSRSVTL